MDSQEIKRLIQSLHLPAVGIAPASIPVPPPSYTNTALCPLAAGQGKERYQPIRLLPSCRSVIVILFPYFTGMEKESNLSLYCRSIDYHLIIQTYLHRIESLLHHAYPLCETRSLVDSSPLDERWLAYQAGLGFFGDNHFLIHPTYGSYCFIASVLTSLPLKADAPLPLSCRHCGRCLHTCPGHCFQNGTYTYERCKSFLTQKKGSLTPPEIAIIQKTPLIFGCDECQLVCPHNQDMPLTPISEFYEDRRITLTAEELQNLSNRQFRQAFGNRAFAWRGKQILLRNMGYLFSYHPGNRETTDTAT